MSMVNYDKLTVEVVKELIDEQAVPRISPKDLELIVRKTVDRYRAAQGKGPEWR